MRKGNLVRTLLGLGFFALLFIGYKAVQTWRLSNYMIGRCFVLSPTRSDTGDVLVKLTSAIGKVQFENSRVAVNSHFFGRRLKIEGSLAGEKFWKIDMLHENLELHVVTDFAALRIVLQQKDSLFQGEAFLYGDVGSYESIVHVQLTPIVCGSTF